MIGDYLTYLQSVKALSPHTRLAYQRDLLAWQDFLQAEEVDLLDAEAGVAGAFLAGLKKSGLASSSVNRTLSCLRGFYTFLLKTGKIKLNPFHGIRNLKQPKVLPNFLFEKEIEALLSLPGEGFQGERDRVILELMYATGCRISEITSANLGDFSADFRSLKVIGKGDKERWVFLTDQARSALLAYLPLREGRIQTGNADAQQALFLNRRGKRLSKLGIAKMLAHYVQKSGLAKKVTPHTLRHTFATHLVNEGLDIRIVQELLGHARLATTQVYTHLGFDRLKDIVRSAHPHG